MRVKVKAAEGVNVPYEFEPFRYIGEEAVDVELTVYYQRRIDDGDLLLVSEEAPKEKKGN